MDGGRQGTSQNKKMVSPADLMPGPTRQALALYRGSIKIEGGLGRLGVGGSGGAPSTNFDTIFGYCGLRRTTLMFSAGPLKLTASDWSSVL